MSTLSDYILAEALKTLLESGKRIHDVVWVGSENYGAITWGKFARLAKDLSFGEVVEDLVIVGIDWWMEIHSFDAYYYWWEFKTHPKEPLQNKGEIQSLKGMSLEEANKKFNRKEIVKKQDT